MSRNDRQCKKLLIVKQILLAITVGNMKITVWRIWILMFRCNRSTRIRSWWGGGGERGGVAFASSLPPMCNPLASPHVKDVPPVLDQNFLVGCWS